MDNILITVPYVLWGKVILAIKNLTQILLQNLKRALEQDSQEIASMDSKAMKLLDEIKQQTEIAKKFKEDALT